MAMKTSSIPLMKITMLPNIVEGYKCIFEISYKDNYMNPSQLITGIPQAF